MARWSIEEPAELSFDRVDAARVSLVGGHVAVLATDGPPRLEVTGSREPPIIVTHENGRLTVGYEDSSWAGLLQWVHGSRRAATVTLAVPSGCPVDLKTVSAGVLVAGIEAATSVRTVGGDVVLDGVGEQVDVQTVSGDLDAQALAGALRASSVSGCVTVASGPCRGLHVKTVSGWVVADLDVASGSPLTLSSMSGDITVRLPRTTGTGVDLRSVSGSVDADFPGLVRTGAPGSRAVHGTLGDGSGDLAATTVSGDVMLLQRHLSGTAAGEAV